jgi:hypothetical protein
MEMSVRFSIRREGVLIAPPRFTYAMPDDRGQRAQADRFRAELRERAGADRTMVNPAGVPSRGARRSSSTGHAARV